MTLWEKNIESHRYCKKNDKVAKIIWTDASPFLYCMKEKLLVFSLKALPFFFYIFGSVFKAWLLPLAHCFDLRLNWPHSYNFLANKFTVSPQKCSFACEKQLPVNPEILQWWDIHKETPVWFRGWWDDCPSNKNKSLFAHPHLSNHFTPAQQVGAGTLLAHSLLSVGLVMNCDQGSPTFCQCKHIYYCANHTTWDSLNYWELWQMQFYSI